MSDEAMKLVPLEPTVTMKQAAVEITLHDHDNNLEWVLSWEEVTKIYKTMISAYTEASGWRKRQICARSHPHEEMDEWCELRTEIARLQNRVANMEQVIPRRKWVGQIDNDEFFESLEQKQGEPDLIECGNCHEGLSDMEHVCKKCLGAGWVNNPKQEQGEPVAVRQSNGEIYVLGSALVPIGALLYTTPQQRTWVGLTPEEMHECYEDAANMEPYMGAITRVNVVKAIEAKLKEKNT